MLRKTLKIGLATTLFVAVFPLLLRRTKPNSRRASTQARRCRIRLSSLTAKAKPNSRY